MAKFLYMNKLSTSAVNPYRHIRYFECGWCYYGGECEEENGYYTCQCRDGFYGNQCQGIEKLSVVFSIDHSCLLGELDLVRINYITF